MTSTPYFYHHSVQDYLDILYDDQGLLSGSFFSELLPESPFTVRSQHALFPAGPCKLFQPLPFTVLKPPPRF